MMGASLEALVRNYNVTGVARLLGREVSEKELENVMTKLGIPILPEEKREQLLRSLEAHRRVKMSEEHFGNNRPISLKEMLKNKPTPTPS